MMGKNSLRKIPAIRFVLAGELAALFLALPFALGQDARQMPSAQQRAAVVVQRRTVPNLQGHTLADARRILANAGLQLGDTSWGTAGGALGTVYAQTPAAGTTVVLGSRINVSLVQQNPRNTPGTSDGEFPPLQKPPQKPAGPDPEFYTRVPELRGRTLEQAAGALQGTSLRLGAQSWGNAKGTPGTIYSQNPPAGQWVPKGTSVNVWLVQQQAKPPEEFPQVRVPDLTKRSRQDAQGILHANRLRLGSVTVRVMPEDFAGAGLIIDQSPRPGVRVPQGTAVSVIVAVPPKLAVVPDVAGSDEATAAGILKNSGLRLGGVQTQESNQSPGIILRQNPLAGTKVKPGSAVSVLVAVHVEWALVPNIIRSSQTAAAGILSHARLRLGGVEERESDENPGTVLNQNPPAGTRVQPGTAISVVVSRAIHRSLIIEADLADPEIGHTVTFRARLVPAADGSEYRFVFGDGSSTKQWTAGTAATHSYQSAGTYQVQGIARVRGKEISSDVIPIRAREADFTVELVPDRHSAKPLEAVNFTAGINRPDLKPQYQFEFGDGETSGWVREANATHTYRNAGRYRPLVRARAARGKEVYSPETAIEIPQDTAINWKKVAQVGGLLALGTGFGVALSKLVGKFIHQGSVATSSNAGLLRAVPNVDLGMQKVDMPEARSADVSVRFRAVSTLGDQTIEILSPNPGGEVTAHG